MWKYLIFFLQDTDKIQVYFTTNVSSDFVCNFEIETIFHIVKLLTSDTGEENANKNREWGRNICRDQVVGIFTHLLDIDSVQCRSDEIILLQVVRLQVICIHLNIYWIHLHRAWYYEMRNATATFVIFQSILEEYWA